MRITRIEISGFRNITHMVLTELTSGLLLTGRNGHGKSSVLDAVRYCLFGRCDHTDRSGRNAARMIGDGAREAQIQIRIQHGGRNIDVLTVLTAKGGSAFSAVQGEELVAETREGLWSALGIPTSHAEMQAAMGQFLAGADFSAVIGAYLVEEIPVADVLEKAQEHAEWLQRWLKARAYAEPAFGVDEWRGIGKGIYEDRTEKNRQLKEMAYEVEALGFTVSPVDESGNRIDLDSLDTIKAQVDVAHKRRDQLHIELGAARGARSKETIKRDLVKATKDLDIAEKKLSEARAELTRIEQAKQDAEVEARGLANRESQLRSKQFELESRANRFKDGRCDKCKSELTTKQLKELTGEAVAELSALTAEKAEVEQKFATATQATEELVAKLNAVRSTFGEAESARAKAAAAVAGLQRERPAERAERVVQEELDAVQVEVAKGETILEQLSRHANHIGLSRRLKEMEAELEHFNWGVKALKDGQVLNELAAGDKKDELLARVNHELAPFGYQLDLQPDGKAWAVMFGGYVHDSTLRHSRRLRPLALCSQGEKWIAQFALCLGFSGEGPVLLDNLDHLDGLNKEQVRLRLQQCDGTVILAGAWNLAKEPEIESLAAAFAPARIVWVEDGAIASATAEEAA